MIDDNVIEEMIKDMPGEKITLEYMLGRVKNINYFFQETSSYCRLELDNGYSVTGHSACVDPANYSEIIGRALSYKDAVRQLWPLFGFLLAEARFTRKK